jgi:hypothetical protein
LSLHPRRQDYAFDVQAGGPSLSVKVSQAAPSRPTTRLSHLSLFKFRIVVKTHTEIGQNHSESLCAALWVPCRICWAWFGPALGPNPARNRRFPAGSLKVVRDLLAQPRPGAVDVTRIWGGLPNSIPDRPDFLVPGSAVGRLVVSKTLFGGVHPCHAGCGGGI